MNNDFYIKIDEIINQLIEDKLFKTERVINTAQSPSIVVNNNQKQINFCANNYLGLADDKELVEYAKKSLDQFGYGVASVRFICGTQVIHKQLEKSISDFLRYEDCILFSSCFDANGGVFESLLSQQDAVISDELNHASIIDGIRLCKASKFKYKNNNMEDLQHQLIEADKAGARFKLIVTDGVFSMDGIIADLKSICDLADQYNAIVLVDDSHATGFIGKNGRGTPEYCGVEGRVDIITGTLGKALGGASGGYIVAKYNVVKLLRNKARPYLFSNSLAPVITATTIKALEIIKDAYNLREKLINNTKVFRLGLTKAGFDLVPGNHPIIPVMLYDEKIAGLFAEKLLQHGIYVVAFSYPVVPKGKARIRTQMCAKHTTQQIEYAINAFTIVGKELSLI